MKSEPNGPKLWDMVLGDLGQAFPQANAVIAGGAIRDYLMGNEEIKDLDVFVNLHDDPRDAVIYDKLWRNTAWNKIRKADLPGNIWDAHNYGHWIGLIFNDCEDQYYAVAGFDYKLGMCYYDGRTIHITPECWECLQTRAWGPTKDSHEHFETVNKRLGGILSYE